MSKKDRHRIDLSLARKLIFETKQYNHGLFELESIKTGVSLELSIKKFVSSDGFTSMRVSQIRKYVGAKYIGRYFKGKFYGVSQADNVDVVAKTLSMLETGNLDLLADKLAVYHHGVCLVCGRRLKTERAVSIGVGSTCESKL